MAPAVPLNTIWAEDGYIWLRDALSHDLFDALTTPYNGYIQSISRLVAAPVSLLPIQAFAPSMALAGAAIVTGCAFVVWRASSGLIQSPLLRGCLATMMILLPTVGLEMLANVTNTIWFLLFAGFWILLWRPVSFVRACGAASVLFVAVVSTAGALALLPVWILRLFAIRDRRDGVILAAFAVGASLQIGLSWGQNDLLGEPGSPQIALTPHWSPDLLVAYLQRVAGGVAGGQWLSGHLWELLGVVFAILLGGALIAFAIAAARTRARIFVALALMISLALFVVSGAQRWTAGGSQLMWPLGESNTIGSHYVVVPTLMLLSALIVWLDTLPEPAARRPWRRPAVAAMAFIGVCALLTFSVGDGEIRGTPTWTRALRDARAGCVTHETSQEVPVVIAPVKQYVVTSVRLPCDRLADR